MIREDRRADRHGREAFSSIAPCAIVWFLHVVSGSERRIVARESELRTKFRPAKLERLLRAASPTKDHHFRAPSAVERVLAWD